MTTLRNEDTGDAEPDAHALTVELRTALGMFAGALPISPKEAWEQAISRVRQLKAELERERMRLVACGVVALANTPDSAIAARNMHDDYRSGSCDAVAKTVDREMRLQAENEALRAERDAVAANLASTQVAWEDWKVRHSTVRLEAELSRMTAERDVLRVALADAIDEVEGWAVYVPAYFLQGTLARLRGALAARAQEPKP